MNHNGILFKDGRFTGRFDEMYEREEECGYDSWDQSDFTYQKQIDLVLANSVMKDDCRVLDLGCGKGLFSSMLKGKAAMVRGIDISGNAILRASAQYHDIEFVVGDIVKDEWGGLGFNHSKSSSVLYPRVEGNSGANRSKHKICVNR